MDTDTAVITASDGREAIAPARFASMWTQEMIDSLVMQAHRAGIADRATCNACGIKAVPA